ncbi:hypothetical protein BDW02DRAFT_508983 [Decorospora gaudefroyi]|uniref:Uncharacterized protein n=1 Tax=Decorospora gaudefroyi TaxID=184978 RepID=A0A6A5K915_9PLEO|nr:hypothetical protein BDW02DRAFT_508983 [Decorospora gaudefroyi]
MPIPTVAAVAFAQTTHNASAKNLGVYFITDGCVNDEDCNSVCCSQVATTGDGI